MDNISKILDAIREDGRAEADKITAAGRKNADEVMKLYNEEASAEERIILKRAEKKAEEISQRGISQAGIESRNMKLAAKRESLAKAYQEALEKLSALSEKEKLKIYGRMIEKYSTKANITVTLNSKDKKTLGEKLAAEAGKKNNVKIQLAEAKEDFAGGIIIGEGEIETNCTFETLIEDSKKTTESDIAAMLFA